MDDNKKVRSLELFVGSACPYCHRVLNWMNANHFVDHVTIYNINEDGAAAKRLVEEGGKRQIPCLFVNGEPLYESTDIIKLLNELKNNPERLVVE